MFKRVITALLGIPLIIYIIHIGGLLLFSALLAICSIGLLEYCKSVNTDENINISYYLEIALGIMLLFIFNFYESLIVAGLFLCFIVIFIYEIIKGKANVLQGIYALFGIIYVPFLLGHISLFRNFENGSFLILLVFIICFSTDTFAYIIGINFGKHKLCPLISPKKSIEGAIGGIVGSLIITSIYGYLMNKYNLLEFQPIYYIVLSFWASILSQFGDLTASLIKRNFNVKDFGNILPGHGGVLDRFDSIIFATPLVYYFTLYYIILG
ncbi:phosphatidate cytidylyltransferase [Alkalibaculum sp. M08DMB]|uniref:Phosphatidate cytidylyltransferase n=1 Tax=Alkalibaculum sporogenes TaxID=2655001 RepID=A0A6A7K8X3_9FIRM|nr:phosphatidate cytidylyltransferase [Alkalibaculum sporogenes]MPW25842.1 phosphatidate cytidylyltransferase [Alkalibaculum sporogenes]